MLLWPVILFNSASLKSDSQRKPDLAAGKTPNHKLDRLCFLDSEDLWLDVPKRSILKPEKFELIVTPRPNADPILDGRKHTLEWLISSKEIRGATEWSELKGCFKKTNPPEGVAARFDLSEGWVYTEEFVREKSGNNTSPLQKVQWSSYDPRYIGLVITCELELEDDTPVKISSKSWAGSDKGTLEFKPNQELAIEIWNVPFDDIASTWKLTHWPQNLKFGDSFLHHYRILDPKGPRHGVDPKIKAVSKSDARPYQVPAPGKSVACSPKLSVLYDYEE